MSSEDIEKGSRWSTEIARELQNTRAGIICVTSENVGAPWLNFEAGALSKSVEKELVCPLLFALKASDLTGPLIQFQSAETTREDIFKLLSTLNKGLNTSSLSETKLKDAYEVWWPKLESKLLAITEPSAKGKPTRSAEDKIAEILTIGREQSRIAQEILTIVSESRMENNLLTSYPSYVNTIQPASGAPYTDYSRLAYLAARPHHGPTLLTDIGQPNEGFGEELLSDEEGSIRSE